MENTLKNAKINNLKLTTQNNNNQPENQKNAETEIWAKWGPGFYI